MDYKKLSNWSIWFVLFSPLLAFFIYYPALNFPFVFDDFSHLVLNRGLRFLHNPEVWLGQGGLKYRPVTAFSYVLDYAQSQLSVSRFHHTNILLHCANLVIFFLILHVRRAYSFWSKLVAMAAITSMPLLGESVVYVSARSTLLAAFFVLCAWYCLELIFNKSSSKRLKYTAMVFYFLSFVLGVAAKESAAIIPGLAFFYFSEKKIKYFSKSAIFMVWLPLLCATIALIFKWEFIRSLLQGRFNTYAELEIYNYLDWIKLQSIIWPKFLAWIFFPNNSLSLVHELFTPKSFFSVAVIAGLLLICSVVFISVICWKKKRPEALGLIFFILAIAPTNTIIPIVDPLAERHLYLSIFGLALAFAAVLEVLSKYIPRYSIFYSILAIILFATNAHSQIQQFNRWRSGADIWLDAWKKNPLYPKAAIGASNAVAAERGEARLAMEIALDAYLQQPFGKLLLWQQNRLQTHASVGLLSYFQSNPDKIFSYLDDLKKKKPESLYWLELLRAEVFNNLGQGKAAVSQLEKMLDLEWEAVHGKPTGLDRSFYSNIIRIYLAEEYAALGERTKAIDHLVIVLQHSMQDELSYWSKRELLADLYVQEKRIAEAIPQYEALVRQELIYKRVNAEVLLKLAGLYESVSEFKKALSIYETVLDYDPSNIAARGKYIQLLKLFPEFSMRLQKQEQIFERLENVKDREDLKIDMIKP